MGSCWFRGCYNLLRTRTHATINKLMDFFDDNCMAKIARFTTEFRWWCFMRRWKMAIESARRTSITSRAAANRGHVTSSTANRGHVTSLAGNRGHLFNFNCTCAEFKWSDWTSAQLDQLSTVTSVVTSQLVLVSLMVIFIAAVGWQLSDCYKVFSNTVPTAFRLS